LLNQYPYSGSAQSIASKTRVTGEQCFAKYKVLIKLKCKLPTNTRNYMQYNFEKESLVIFQQ